MFVYKGSYKKECIKVEPFANCHQLVTENLFAVPVSFQLHPPSPPPPPPTPPPPPNSLRPETPSLDRV